MNVSLFNFRKSQVRVVTDEDGTPLFVGKDLCDLLEYTNANKAMGDHCKGVTKRRPVQTLGGIQLMRVLTEPDTFRLIIGSHMPAAQDFENWIFDEVLPTIRRTGGYNAIQAPAPSANDATILIESMARTMKLPPSATLGMYQRYAAKIGQTDLLPAYAIDAPDGGDSSHTTGALATLLKKSGIPATARKAYLCMQSAGLVERKQRPSKTKGVKEFWSLTDAGLAYGKNVTNPANQLEVQVHIFESKFDDLCELLDMHDLR